MEAALIIYARSKIMKKLISRISTYVRKEWFLITVVIALTLIMVLFELLN